MTLGNLFNKQEFIEPSFFQRLFNKKPKENAVIEINNLFSESNCIKDITIEDIHSIAEKYNVKLLKEFHEDLELFYRIYLKHCLSDKKLSDDERDDLLHIKNIFNLNDKSIESIHNDIAGLIYKTSVEKVISDGRVDLDEKEFLIKLKNDLALPTNIADNIYNSSA